MAAHAADRLQWLQHQIARGWRLEAPVLERAAYHGASGRVSAFEFVLRGEEGCQVVAVPDSPELRRFIDERSIDVVLL